MAESGAILGRCWHAMQLGRVRVTPSCTRHETEQPHFTRGLSCDKSTSRHARHKPAVERGHGPHHSGTSCSSALSDEHLPTTMVQSHAPSENRHDTGRCRETCGRYKIGQVVKGRECTQGLQCTNSRGRNRANRRQAEPVEPLTTAIRQTCTNEDTDAPRHTVP